ncbi:hypothetical protein HUT18_00910 [Streptomyces sp. NA04227]|uniref:DUF5709 domain-containing protein n=1 Tax=Streptomyces sp. NA04227 TaxID=2742136 RepID=UPI0015928478|nr:DUF5709 domain-containing protein [Streptomyces sp. NA04227]QKW10571.1 hypothetical protein HUT18_00910 [Streptomyces sp. NA04227]
MDRDNARGDDVYQPDGSEVQDDEGPLEADDTLLIDEVHDPLDEGYSPPERPLGVESSGVTVSEQMRGETLDERLAEEIPDVPVPDGRAFNDPDEYFVGDGQVGMVRAGRLVAPDEGAHQNVEGDTFASDVGIDGAAASAEEAAMHVVDDSEDYATFE